MPTHNPASARPTVSVIVLNYNGLNFLPRCLETLGQTTYRPLEIVVVDNASTDGSVAYLLEHHPGVKLICHSTNLGYSRGYNAALKEVGGEFIVFLNFDVEVEPDWLDSAMEMFGRDPQLAAIQPKLKSLQDRRLFEYSGGSGGFIDRYGYPFARGRLFEHLEVDTGQYEDAVPIFWASGAAFITRRIAYEQVGGLDDDFFLHMEELDLCWRYWLCGWKVMVAPGGVVYHHAGAALSAARYRKMYYNHRNGLVLLIKNVGAASFWRRLCVRWLLDVVTVVVSLFSGRWKRAAAVVAAHGYVLAHIPRLWAKRRQVQRMRRVADSALHHVIFPGSIVWRYFVCGQKTYSQLRVGW